VLVEADSPAAQHRAMEYDAETAFQRLTRHRGPEPLVIEQLGQSIDGRIAADTAHLLRLGRAKTALSQALLTGRVRVPTATTTTNSAAVAAGASHG